MFELKLVSRIQQAIRALALTILAEESDPGICSSTKSILLWLDDKAISLCLRFKIIGTIYGTTLPC